MSSEKKAQAEGFEAVMTPTDRIVLSASRRTDIPAFFMDWFMAGIRAGGFDVENPFNRRIYRVEAGREKVHAIVFWSKNYGPFLEGDYGKRLARAGYRLLFQFTLNSHSAILEPNTPQLAVRLNQLRCLARRYPQGAVVWRFDPLCWFRRGPGPIQNNLGDFRRIADTAAAAGIERCVGSFADHYRKVLKRARDVNGFQWVDPSRSERHRVLRWMSRLLAERGIRLELCCEREILSDLPADLGISGGSCISHQWVEKVYGGSLSGKRDRGQRVAAGCGCMESKDIGSYRLQPCPNNCLYCYANPTGAAASA